MRQMIALCRCPSFSVHSVTDLMFDKDSFEKKKLKIVDAKVISAFNFVE